MNGRILKKIRNFRLFSGLLIMALTVLSFQNCAPQNATCSDNSSNCSNEGSTSSPSTSTNQGSIWSSRPGNGNSSGVNIGGGSGGGSVSAGGSGGNSGSSGGGIAVGGGGSSSGGGGGGVSTGGNDDPKNTTFRITKQPQGVSVLEKADFQLDVTIAGGDGPYTFQWYKDSKAISGGFGNYSSYMDNASSYSKEGTYYVVVKDGNGQSIQSSLARVSILEPAVGCVAGSYFTYTVSSYDTAYKYFGEYFDGPKGKFLLHSSFDIYNFLYPNASWVGLSTYSVPSALQYLQKTWMSCLTTVPRIHTPQPNPGFPTDYWYYNNSQKYNDGYGYNYKGTITFECRNKKLKFVSNTCAWEKDPNYVPPEQQSSGY